MHSFERAVKGGEPVYLAPIINKMLSMVMAVKHCCKGNTFWHILVCHQRLRGPTKSCFKFHELPTDLSCRYLETFHCQNLIPVCHGVFINTSCHNKPLQVIICAHTCTTSRRKHQENVSRVSGNVSVFMGDFSNVRMDSRWHHAISILI